MNDDEAFVYLPDKDESNNKAFSCLQESLYCVISRLNYSNYFVIDVKLNSRYMRSTI